MFCFFHLIRDVLQTRGFNYRCEAWKVGEVANTTGDGADMFRLLLLCDATVDSRFVIDWLQRHVAGSLRSSKRFRPLCQ